MTLRSLTEFDWNRRNFHENKPPLSFRNTNANKKRKNCRFKEILTKRKDSEDWQKMTLREKLVLKKKMKNERGVLKYMRLNFPSSVRWKKSLERGKKKRKQLLRNEKLKKKRNSEKEFPNKQKVNAKS